MICKTRMVEGCPARPNERITDLHLREEGAESWERFDLLITRCGVIALGGAALIQLCAGVTFHHHRYDSLPLPPLLVYGDGNNSLLCPLTTHCITTVSSPSTGWDQLTVTLRPTHWESRADSAQAGELRQSPLVRVKEVRDEVLSQHPPHPSHPRPLGSPQGVAPAVSLPRLVTAAQSLLSQPLPLHLDILAGPATQHVNIVMSSKC